MEDNVGLENVRNEKKKKKPSESGIIYLSRIPTLMNVNIIRRHFENFGEVGRIFLQPDARAKSRGKRGRAFSEGWVEFTSKKVAKRVAAALNNQLIGGKKKNKWREELWNIKYLSRFKWAHLNERLAYEKAVHAQRMRTEISQAKREANFHIQNAEKRERLAKKELREKKRNDKKKSSAQDVSCDVTSDGNNDSMAENEHIYTIRLKDTEDEIVRKRKLGEETTGDKSRASKVFRNNKDTGTSEEDVRKKKAFLSKIFSSGVDNSDDD